jgi:hypothetical protein
LLAATAQVPDADDVVVQADGAVLRGHVISCGDRIRFVPNGSREILFTPESVLAVTRASGEPCVVRRPRNVGGGIVAIIVFPLLGAALGSVVGSQMCHGDDTTPCVLGGAAAGAAIGVLVGGTVLVVSALSTDERALPQAIARRSPGRSTGFSLAVRF